MPGFDFCELMPLQATIADKLALVRNMAFNPNFHDPVELFSGCLERLRDRAPGEGFVSHPRKPKRNEWG